MSWDFVRTEFKLKQELTLILYCDDSLQSEANCISYLQSNMKLTFQPKQVLLTTLYFVEMNVMQ